MGQILLLFAILPAIFVFALGVSVFVAGHPIVMASRWIRIFSVCAILPIMMIRMHGMAHNPLPLAWLLMLALSWRASAGYTIYGISSTGLRQALLAVLQKMNLSYTEDMTGITLTNPEVKLGAMMSGFGVCRLRTKNRQAHPLLKQIAGELSGYVKANKVKMTYTFNILYTLLGLILLASLLMMYIGVRDSAHARAVSAHLENGVYLDHRALGQ